jgi:SAM-dependent methyltransferase
LSAGLADRITAHLLETGRLPLPDATLDRVTARNVRDPVAAFTEFRRVLKPNGRALVIERDWAFTAVEPLAGIGKPW